MHVDKAIGNIKLPMIVNVLADHFEGKAYSTWQVTLFNINISKVVFGAKCL